MSAAAMQVPIEDTDPFGPLTPVRLGDGVVAALSGAILDGRLEAGARLPSARQLARDWRVSRNTVDDALAVVLHLNVGEGEGRGPQVLREDLRDAVGRSANLDLLREIGLDGRDGVRRDRGRSA